MRILVSKPDALGDQVLAAGFVQAVRRRWPDARIVWHVREGMDVIATLVDDASVFRPDPAQKPTEEAARLWTQAVTPIVLVPGAIHPYSDWRPDLAARFQWWGEFIAATAWDIAIAPVVNRTGLSDFTVTISNAPQRLGFGPNAACQPLIEAVFTPLPKKQADFTIEVPPSLDQSEWQQHARLLAALAPEASLLAPVLRLPEAAVSEAAAICGATSQLVLIAPGVGQNTQRAWPLEQFARVAGELRARGYDVRWIEGPQDTAFFQKLPAHETSARLRIAADQLPLLAALIRSAQLLLCNDTAYVHLAAAFDTPTVAVYGAGQKGRFIPQFGRVRVVQGDPVCRGCQWQCAFARQVCVQDVPYPAVWTAIEAQLQAARSVHQRVPVSLPFPDAPDSFAELERVRDWYQLELDRIRWDGWARLQIINDVLERLKTCEQHIAALTAERNDLAARLSAQANAPTPPPLPKLSVIIPMGRPERAAGTMQSLARQTLRPAQWEVVVVGVGASTLVAQYPQLPLVPVDLERNLLPPRTRVEGVKRATGDCFLFVDDDVQLAPDFFEMLARVLAIPPAPATPPAQPIGAIGVRLPGGRGTYFEHLTDISNFWSQQSPLRAVPHTVGFLYSAALVVRAEAYHRSGGFNPDLPNGEDVDLTQRIKAAGYLLAYEPSLVAYHHHGRDSVLRMWRYFWRNGNAARHFFSATGGAWPFSVKTVWQKSWSDLRMNRAFQQSRGVRLGLHLPLIWLNYLIVEASLEWHWQEYLWHSRRFRELPATTAGDRTAVRAFVAFDEGRPLRAVGFYTLALLQNFTAPVRR